MLLLGKCRICVTGLNLTKLLSALSLQGVRLYEIRREDHKKLTFFIRYNDRVKVIAYLNKMCYNYTADEDLGAIPFLLFFAKRAGLIVGLAAFLVLTILSAFFVADVRIDGLKYAEAEQVESVLHELGVRKGSFLRLPEADIERGLYQNIKNAAFVRVRYQGAVLKISVVETQPLPVILSTEAADIVSGYDGVITRLLVYQGTPLVKAGDTVKKGQVLIGGYRESPDGARTPVRALGEAYGEAVITHNELFFEERTVLSRTGRWEKESFIDTLGVIFPIKKVQLSGSYETEEQRSYIFYNNIMPSVLVERTHYYTEYITVKEDFEKVKKAVVENAEQTARERAEESGIIKRIITDIYTEDAGRRIEVKVHIEKSFI